MQAQAAEQAARTARQKAEAAEETALAEAQDAKTAADDAERLRDEAETVTDQTEAAAEAAEAQTTAAQLQSAFQRARRADGRAADADQQAAAALQLKGEVEALQAETLAATDLERQSRRILRQAEAQPDTALVAAMRAGRRLQSLAGGRSLSDYPTAGPIYTLQTLLDKSPSRPLLTGRVVAANDDFIVTASGDAAKIWDWQGQAIATLPHQAGVVGVEESADGQRLITYSRDNTVRVWTWQGQELATLEHPAAVRGVVLNDDPNNLTIFTDAADGSIGFWPIHSLSQLLERGCDYLAHYLRARPERNQFDSPAGRQPLCPRQPSAASEQAE